MSGSKPSPAPLRGLVALALTLAFAFGPVSPAVPAARAQEPAKEEKKEEGEKKKEEKKEEGLPLKPEGKVEFATDEGTWMSVDLSPDGQSVVFDLLGDIYRVPAAGGEARLVSGGMAFESQPRYSPDGKRIVFTSDRSGSENVWTMNPDGTAPKAVTEGADSSYASPEWTADGQFIIASKSAGLLPNTLWVYHRDGGSGFELDKRDAPAGGGPGGPPTPQNLPNRMGAVTSPDGRFVYFAERRGGFTYNATFPLWQVRRYDRQTGETSTVTNAQGSAMRPAISPDGKTLVFATRHDTKTGLKAKDLTTGEERWIKYPVTRDDQESRATRDTWPGYSFTADGRELVVTHEGKIQRLDVATGAARVVPFSAKVSLDVGARSYFQYRVEESPVRARLIRWPALSPDGTRVVFSSLSRLYVMDLPAGQPKRLTDSAAGEFFPVWSPDGREIAYVTWAVGGGQIMKVAAAGGSPRQLTTVPAYYGDLAWSPDGARIVYVAGTSRDKLYSDLQEEIRHSRSLYGAEEEAEIAGVDTTGTLDLRWIPAAGGDSQFIAPTQGGRSPHFSRDDSRIFLTTNDGLASVRLDGLDRRAHVKITGSPLTGLPPRPAPAAEMRVSPDGTRVFADVQNRHYLASVPVGIKQTLEVSIAGKTGSLPFKKLSAEGGDYLRWSPDGKFMTWSWGNKFYRQAVDAEKPEAFEVRIEVPRAKPRGTVVLKGAKIVTMRGDEIIRAGDVVVTDNRIAGVGPTGKVAVPAGAKVIDVKGKTIIPGLVDVHSHMWPPRGVQQNQVWQYLANLAYGVTTTRDPQSSTTDVFGYMDLADAGEIIGPRIYSTGPGVFAGSGVADKDAAMNYIKRYKEAYRTTTLKQYVVGDRKVRQWVVMATRQHGVTPTTEGALDMKLDLSQIIDGYSGNEHALPIQPLYNDVVQLLARTRTYYTPTLLVAYGAPWSENYFYQTTDVHGDQKLRRFIPHELVDVLSKRRPWFSEEEHGFKGLAESAAKVVRAGGRVTLGGHGQLQGLGSHWELWALQSGGLTPHETLRAATIHGAEAIGLQQDLGSLEAGKLADLLVLDRDPLANIRNSNSISWVMRNGELFNAATLDQVWPAERKLAGQYWWDGEPTTPAAAPAKKN